MLNKQCRVPDFFQGGLELFQGGSVGYSYATFLLCFGLLCSLAMDLMYLKSFYLILFFIFYIAYGYRIWLMSRLITLSLYFFGQILLLNMMNCSWKGFEAGIQFSYWANCIGTHIHHAMMYRIISMLIWFEICLICH